MFNNIKQLRLHIYKELKDFIRPTERNNTIVHAFSRRASIKDVLESYNVPHTEIDLILVNKVSVDFDYIVKNGDDIHVFPDNYPVSKYSHTSPLLHLSSPAPDQSKFVVDVNLGRLARYLRLLGLDCLYCNKFADATIAEISSTTQRTVLTRDRKLLQRKIIIYGYFVRAENPKTQVKEVLSKFNLYPLLKPLTRCTYCNGKLIDSKKHNIVHRLKPLTQKYYDKFLICSECSRIYWQGSHCKRISRLINEFSKDTK